MNYTEFAGRIKQKHPEYAEVDDRVLAEKVIAKHPVYKDQVTFDTIDRKAVIEDIKNPSQVMDLVRTEGENTADTEKRANAGLAASFLASGGMNYDAVSGSLDSYTAAYVGREGATSDEMVTTLREGVKALEGVSYETADKDLFPDADSPLFNPQFIWSEKGPIPAQGEGVPTEYDIALQDAETAPRLRAMEAAARAYAPKWSHEALEIPERTQPIGAQEWTEEVVGTIAGNIAAFKTAGWAFRSVGGFRAIPGAGNLLNQIGQQSPRAARMLERAGTTFIVLGGKNQFHSDSKDLKERAEMLQKDAIISAAFPVADWLAEVKNVGIPLAASAMFLAGSAGEETWEGKIVGGTSLTMMWAMSHGASFREAVKTAEGVAKAAGVDNPKEFVSSLNRGDILKGAENIKDQIWRNQYIKDAASEAASKAASGMKLLVSEKLAVAKAHEAYAVVQGKSGEIAPIQADLQAMKARAVMDAVKQNAVASAPPALPAPMEAPAIETQSQQPPSPAVEAPAPEVTPEQAREPWEMTSEEAGEMAWRHDYESAKIALAQSPNSDVLKQYVLDLEKTKGSPHKAKGHYWQVKHAIDEGRPVPDNVRRSYPDLLSPEEAREAAENQLIKDAVDFDQTDEQLIKNLAMLPEDPAAMEEYDESLLPVLWTPDVPPPQQDFTTPEGDEAFIKTVSMFKRSVGNFVRKFRRFGQQYIEDPELGKKFETLYHGLSAAPIEGILDVHNQIKVFEKTRSSVRAELSYALEAETPENLQEDLLPLYRTLVYLKDNLEKAEIEAGVLAKDFKTIQAARIADLDSRILQAKGKQRDALMEERSSLEMIKAYVSHNIVLRRVMEDKLANTPVGFKRGIGKKLSQFHKERKGTHSLKEYVEAGIISESDADVVKLMMSSYADGYHKIAMRGFIEMGKENGYIVPENAKVDDPQDWFLESNLHPAARVGGMEGMKMHRLFATGMEDLGGKDGMAYNFFDKILGVTKVGQFNNPMIIWRHNFSQAMLGGTIPRNPVKGAQWFADSVKAVSSKNELWRELNEAGLYQKTDLPTKKAVDQIISDFAAKTKEYAENQAWSDFVAKFGALTGLRSDEMERLFQNKEFAEIAGKIVMAAPSLVSQITWAGDEVQRTMSAIVLMEEHGYTAQEAAAEAARIHGAYSNVGLPYKNAARRIFFVYSFRLLMPQEYLIKPYVTLVKEAHKFAKGKEIDEKAAKAAGWKIMATTLIPFLLDIYMKTKDWERDEMESRSGYGKLGDKLSIDVPIGGGKTASLRPAMFATWRYAKTIDTPNGPKDMKFVVNTPNIAFTRWGVRASYDDEFFADNPAKGVLNALKAEIHPLYRLLPALVNNEPLDFGSTDLPRGPDGSQWGRGIGKMLLKTFRIYGTLSESEALPWGKDKKWADTQMEEHLTAIEQLVTWFGFKYLSVPQKVSDGYAAKGIERKLHSLVYRVMTDPDTPQSEKDEFLKEATKHAQKRIKEVMNKKPATFDEEMDALK
jgi:hypothetical protein